MAEIGGWIMERKNFMGLDGFVWFMGVVENRLDPLNLNRVQIRCFGFHTDDKSLIPTADLPWGQPILPINDAQTAYSPKEGDYVVGFFTDGSSAQFPIIMGVLPGIPEVLPPISKGFTDPRTAAQLAKAPKKPQSRNYPTNGTGVVITEKSSASRYPDVLNEPTTSRVARNESIEKTLIQERKDNVVKNVPTATGTWTEPTTKYKAVFPYDKVLESESGHLIEIDDTVGVERLSTAHRSGTFEEVHPDGSKVTKVVKNNYEVIMADDNVYVMGKCNITVQGDATLYVEGQYDVKVDKDYNLTVGGNYNVKVLKDYNLTVLGSEHDSILLNKIVGIGGQLTEAVALGIDITSGIDYTNFVGGLYSMNVLGSHRTNVGVDMTSTVVGAQVQGVGGLFTTTVGGVYTAFSLGIMNMTAPIINLNQGA